MGWFGLLEAIVLKVLDVTGKEMSRVEEKVDDMKSEFIQKVSNASTEKLHEMRSDVGGWAKEEIELELSRRRNR